MSDFINAFWANYVAVIVAVSILACVLLLVLTARKKVVSDANNTTGHVWDEDLMEMNNPLPLWWVGLFVITIVFAVLYLFLYPGLGQNQGQFKWTSRDQHAAEVAKANEALKPLYAQYDAMKVEDLAKDPKAHAIGERLFMNNCAQCHGSDAHGSKSFPNLTDNDWLYGGEPDTIKQTITKGRNGVMPPMAAAVGTPEEVRNLANYVLSLSNSPHDNVRAQLGKSKFVACAACHGADGKGMHAVGAPNLTDKIWLHGWGEQTVIAMINAGKNNLMPGQEGRLTPSQIHVLTAYVWGLSNNR